MPLLVGDLPLYRPLHTGVPDGPDVRVLEQNLAALGYGDGLAVDETFSAATAAAVNAWQHDLGLAETGAVGPGDAVVLPAAVRIASVAAQLGAPAQGNLLTVTRTTRSVTVDLPVAQQELASRGARVQVELPDGRLVAGTVASIGTAVTSDSGDGSGDIFIAFSTANPGAGSIKGIRDIKMLPNDQLNPIFLATVQATEEAVINAMIAAQTMRGVNDREVIALPHDRLREVLKKYNRLVK